MEVCWAWSVWRWVAGWWQHTLPNHQTQSQLWAAWTRREKLWLSSPAFKIRGVLSQSQMVKFWWWWTMTWMFSTLWWFTFKMFVLLTEENLSCYMLYELVLQLLVCKQFVLSIKHWSENCLLSYYLYIINCMLLFVWHVNMNSNQEMSHSGN